jgi:hypothetical protein
MCERELVLEPVEDSTTTWGMRQRQPVAATERERDGHHFGTDRTVTADGKDLEALAPPTR